MIDRGSESSYENPDRFTVTGVLVVLFLGASIFGLLYSGLAAPQQPAETLLPTVASPAATTVTHPTAPATRTAGSAAAASPADTPPSTATPTTTPTATPSATPTEQVTPTPEPSPTDLRPTPSPVALEVATDGSTLYLRAQPDTSAEILKVLQDGDAVEGLSPVRQLDGRHWRQIRTADGTTGWASADFLESTR